MILQEKFPMPSTEMPKLLDDVAIRHPEMGTFAGLEMAPSFPVFGFHFLGN